ncbi:MAG: hypothetical protein K2H86_09100, partial [Muribaculaceae bacterium]|nr:hypothetical protein [Muribaculaceae bacterium]
MKHIPLHKIFVALTTLLMVNILMTGCNAKSEDEEPENQPSVSVAVRSFKLNPNARVLANLDSVFFSIDLDRGIIFNADSLPKGTDIEKLVPVITFPSTVETAEIIMEGGNRMEGIVNYKTNPSDTIDFSGRVTLRLTANKGSLSRDYQIRVNVHKAVADSIMWDKMASSALPSRLADPRAQKTVAMGETIYTLIEEHDATYTLSKTRDVASANWTKKVVSLPEQVSVTSFTATESALFILGRSGALLTSADGETWSSTGVSWVHIIGGYGKSLLGISQATGGVYMHDMYPAGSDFVSKPIAQDFPTAATSNLMTFTSKWSSEPYAWFTGGVRDGKTLSATWSYDGAT